MASSPEKSKEDLINWEFDYHPPPNAPPSYLEAIGGTMPSNLQDIQVAWPTNYEALPVKMPNLTYADFLPICLKKTESNAVFENFDVLISRANEWLRKNPDYQVKTCETLERKLDTKTYIAETESTYYHEPAFGKCSFIKVLRVWFCPREFPNSKPDQIGCVNVLPNGKEKVLEVFSSTFSGNISGRTGMKSTWTFKIPCMEFETQRQVIDRLNEKLTESPLPGRIINVETSNLKYAEGYNFKISKPNANDTYYYSTGCTANMFISMFRVFYLYGSPVKETIGIEDFVPEITKRPLDHSLTGLPRWEPQSQLLERAGHWIQDNKINAVSIQTIDCDIEQHNQVVPSDALMGKHREKWSVDSQSMYHLNVMEIKPYRARVVRVAYINSSCLEPPKLSWNQFLPVKIGYKVFETTYQTVERVIAWLNATGAQIFAIETYSIEQGPESKIDHSDESTYTISMVSGKYWKTIIRVYFAGDYKVPVQVSQMSRTEKVCTVT